MQNCLLSGYYVLRELRPRARVVLPLPVILTRGSACGPVRAWAMLVFVRRSAARPRDGQLYPSIFLAMCSASGLIVNLPSTVIPLPSELRRSSIGVLALRFPG